MRHIAVKLFSGSADLSYFDTGLSKFGFDREGGLKLSGTWLRVDEARIYGRLIPDNMRFDPSSDISYPVLPHTSTLMYLLLSLLFVS